MDEHKHRMQVKKKKKKSAMTKLIEKEKKEYNTSMYGNNAENFLNCTLKTLMLATTEV